MNASLRRADDRMCFCASRGMCSHIGGTHVMRYFTDDNKEVCWFSCLIKTVHQYTILPTVCQLAHLICLNNRLLISFAIARPPERHFSTPLRILILTPLIIRQQRSGKQDNKSDRQHPALLCAAGCHGDRLAADPFASTLIVRPD